MLSQTPRHDPDQSNGRAWGPLYVLRKCITPPRKILPSYPRPVVQKLHFLIKINSRKISEKFENLSLHLPHAGMTSNTKVLTRSPEFFIEYRIKAARATWCISFDLEMAFFLLLLEFNL